MSKQRWLKIKGYCHADPNITRTTKGPNGRPMCRWCGVEVPPRRRSWCSDQCVDEYLVRSSGSHVRRLLYKRDRGICAVCKLNCSKLNTFRKSLPYALRREYEHLYRMNYRSTLWDADHIVSVKDGGGCCSLDNYQLLCWMCHADKTAKQAKERRKCTATAD